MRLAFWLAWKSSGSERLQTLCAVLGIAFGVATVTAVEVVDENTVRGAREYHRRESGNPDVELSIRDLSRLKPLEANDKLRAVPGVLGVTPLQESRVLLEASDQRPEVVALLGLDFASILRFEPFALAAGRLPEADDEVLVGAALADALSLKLESRLSLRRPPATLTGCADGQIVLLDGVGQKAGAAVSCRVVGILERRWLGADHRGRIVLANAAGSDRVQQGAPVATRYWVRLDREDRVSDLKTAVGALFDVRIPTSRLIAASPEERAFRSGVRLAALMALLLGLFVIFHLLQLSVTAGVRQSGLLGALGVPAHEIGRVFLARALIISVAGALLGLLLGIGLGAFLYENRFTTLGWQRPKTSFSVDFSGLYWIPIAGIGSALLGAIHPLARLKRVQTLDALVQGEAALGARVTAPWVLPLIVAITPAALLGAAFGLKWLDAAVLRTSLGLAFLFGVFMLLLFALPRLLAGLLPLLLRPFARPGSALTWLAQKNMPRNIRRFAGSIAGTSLVAAGLVTLQAMTGALRSETDTFAQRVLPGKVFVYAPAIEAKALQALIQVDGVQSTQSLDADFPDGPLQVRGVAPAPLWQAGLFPNDPKQRLAFERGEGIILSRRAARDTKLKVGELWRTSPYGRPHEFRVLAIDDRFGFFPDERSYAVVAEDVMRQVYCRAATHWSRVVLTLAPGADEDKVRASIVERKTAAKIDESGGKFTVVTGSAQREFFQREIKADFAIFDVILWLSAILGALGLLNALVVTGLERRHELALLRAVGFSQSRVRRLFLLEATSIGGLGALFGALLGLPFGIATVKGLAAMSDLELSATPGLFGALFVILGLTAVSFLAALIPAAQAGKTDVVSALKCD